MIYLQINALIQAKRAEWGRKVTLTEVADHTGISRMTLFRMMKNEGYNTVTDHLDKLCEFFECDIQALVKFVPNQLSTSVLHTPVQATKVKTRGVSHG